MMAKETPDGAPTQPGGSQRPSDTIRYQVEVDRKIAKGHHITWALGDPPQEVVKDAQEGVAKGWVHGELTVGKERWKWDLIPEELPWD